jgi:hypothetical protein
MNSRISTFPPLLALVLLMPQVATGQTPDSQPAGFDRVSLQVAAGPLVNSGGGHTLSAAFGFSPISRVDLVVNVERQHLPFQRGTFSDGFSVTRGGTLTWVSGEVRASLFPPDRVSPYGLAGIGGGVSRPTVNETFPNAVENDLRVVYFGGGVRVPIRSGFSVFGDARAMLTLEGSDGILGVWPVRAGIAWRF